MSNGTTTISYTPGGADDPANLLHYMPSMGAAIASLVFYTLSFLSLSFWTIWKRSWYMIPLLVACIMEIIGYATRIPLAANPIGQTILYSCMETCVIFAPVFNAATEYILLGRLMYAVGDQYSLVKPKLVSRIFIICDVISFIIQSAGAGVLTSAGENLNTAKTGEDILLAGLAVNLISFAVFCLQIFYFDYRTRKSPSEVLGGGLCQKGWRQFLYVIYVSSFLLLLRQIYRVIEFAEDFTGYFAVHEIYFYIFDTLLIFVSTTIYAVFFPGYGYLPQDRNNTFATIMNNQGNIKKHHENNVVIPVKDVAMEENF